MKLEKLSDKSLFKILKIIYTNVDEIGELYEGYVNKTVDQINEVLKNLGMDTDFLNTQYLYVCLRDNWNALENDELKFKLNRPTLNDYDIRISCRFHKTCDEYYDHTVKSYDSDIHGYVYMMTSIGDFFPSDGKYVDEDCDNYEMSDWEIESVKKLES